MYTKIYNFKKNVANKIYRCGDKQIIEHFIPLPHFKMHLNQKYILLLVALSNKKRKLRVKTITLTFSNVTNVLLCVLTRGFRRK